MANKIEIFLPALMSYTGFPTWEIKDFPDRKIRRIFREEHAKRIQTMNMMERVNKELKRRVKVVRVFPDEDAPLRLAGYILMDINESGRPAKVFDNGKGMIRQGDMAQTNYRRSEALPTQTLIQEICWRRTRLKPHFPSPKEYLERNSKHESSGIRSRRSRSN